ncbi:hypothetical protein N7G274_004231 [Stereocaulon virgatum]|uniref:Uncharacterized protein n=1 Tax=Stereocaulon virgatum TaxID=373712 RepID=A0ABR4AE68_9LECA
MPLHYLECGRTNKQKTTGTASAERRNPNEEEADATSVEKARYTMNLARLGSQDIPQFDLRALPNQPELAAEQDATPIPATVNQNSTDSGSSGRRSHSYGSDA